VVASSPAELRTRRLVLRRWRDTDRAPFAALNADPEVMRYFPGTLTAEQTDAYVDRIETLFDEQGFGLWALERAGTFLGFTGLAVPGFEIPCLADAGVTRPVEVGWRLARAAWGHGYATEAATAVLDDAFGRVGLDAVISFTARVNSRSRAVMRRLGLSHVADFDHPKISAESSLYEHVLYGVTADAWRKLAPG
jgi:RimJ/RimL family protein N-acetyltransferase